VLLITNATINTFRATFNAGTKASSAPAAKLTSVPVYIREIGNGLRARGLDTEYDARMTFDAQYDIVDGDEITGYDPLGYGSGGADGRSLAPRLTVQHTELKNGLLSSHKVCLLKIKRS
jgi:hypothetical protein